MTQVKRGRPKGSYKMYPAPCMNINIALNNARLAVCSKCELILKLDRFYKNPYNKIGRDYQCKRCKSEYSKLYHRGKLNEHSQAKKENRGD